MEKTQEINADLHNHGFFGTVLEKVSKTIEHLANVAIHAGLDVLAFTDFMDRKSSGYRDLILPTLSLSQGYDACIFPDHVDMFRHYDGKKVEIVRSQEVPTKQGHILVYGAQGDVYGNNDVLDTARQVRDSNGIVIACHPLAMRGIGLANILKLNEKGLIDALEWNSGLPWPFSRTNHDVANIASEISLPLIATQDSHSSSSIGCSYTVFSVKSGEIDYSGSIKDAIKGKRIVRLQKSRGSPIEFVRHIIYMWNNNQLF